MIFLFVSVSLGYSYFINESKGMIPISIACFLILVIEYFMAKSSKEALMLNQKLGTVKEAEMLAKNGQLEKASSLLGQLKK